ncbi:hypothetical protein PIB30_104537, partial [Stylosanthes scabra]|nr:hypothetical protein [Stylosanthes scabra]
REYVADKDLLEKILDLRLRPWDVHFEYVSRDFNTIADFLAKQGANDDRIFVEWLESGQELQCLLVADLA